LSPVLVDEDLNPVSQGLIQVVSEFNELLVTHLYKDAEMCRKVPTYMMGKYGVWKALSCSPSMQCATLSTPPLES
jgi:hypothetical protein